MSLPLSGPCPKPFPRTIVWSSDTLDLLFMLIIFYWQILIISTSELIVVIYIVNKTPSRSWCRTSGSLTRMLGGKKRLKEVLTLKERAPGMVTRTVMLSKYLSTLSKHLNGLPRMVSKCIQLSHGSQSVTCSRYHQPEFTPSPHQYLRPSHHP